VQPIEAFAPEPAVDEIVPLRNQIVDRTTRSAAIHHLARVTKGHTAIHAARRLVAQALLIHVMVEFLPITDALLRYPVNRQLA